MSAAMTPAARLWRGIFAFGGDEALLDGRQRLGESLEGFRFHRAVLAHDIDAEWRQVCRAAALAAVLALYQRLAEHVVELVDQIPRTLVGHVHRLCGFCDGAVLANQLEQLNAAVADVPYTFEVDADLN